MKKIINKLESYWIFLLIAIQPILDVLSYYEMINRGISNTWWIRALILFFIIFYTFLKSKNKKRLLYAYSIYILFFIMHSLNLIRTNNFNIISDIKYFVLVYQMPIIFISLTDFIKNDKQHIEKIENGLTNNFLIIFFIILLSIFTKTYQQTYTNGGIIGWFSSANTISMIICALAPWFLYEGTKKNWIYYFIHIIITFFVLYTNGTKSCYLTLLFSIIAILFKLIVNKHEQKYIKIIITTFFLIISLFSFKYSITNIRLLEVIDVNQQYKEEIDNTTKNEKPDNNVIQNEKPDNNVIQNEKPDNNVIQNDIPNNVQNEENIILINKLNTSYIYKELIEIHGENKVLKALNYNVPIEILQDNRFRKKLNAKIEFNNSDILTKFLGIGYSRVDKYKLDLENDLSAIYYYYGYLGYTLYMSLFVYIMFNLGKLFIKNYKIIFDDKYIILAFIIVLLIFGGEYSGAFLRKANANIYLSFYLILAYFKIIKKDNKKINKITFLNLHLGYGGIETATINTANCLCEKYDVEIVSLYNLEKNQENIINKKVKIRYLYNGEPNRQLFYKYLHEKKYFKTLLEGVNAIKILFLKKYLIIKYIKNSDSKYIVSTRYDFSKLLSKYKPNNVIAIAQEHHHHNNDKKYLNILKKLYNNIDYLFALTKDLANDYKEILKNNNYTKVVVVPNMLKEIPTKKSNLDKNNIIYIGRLHKGKKVDELVEIVNLTKNVNKFFIIGDGEDFNLIKTKISNLNLFNKIEMLGYKNQKEISKYLNDSSLFIMASISEGLPMVLLESMSHGVPAIAFTTDSGVGDIIDNKKNGYIINDRNKKEFAKCIDELLENKNKLKKFSEKALLKAEQFYSENILKIWDRILNNKR